MFNEGNGTYIYKDGALQQKHPRVEVMVGSSADLAGLSSLAPGSRAYIAGGAQVWEMGLDGEWHQSEELLNRLDFSLRSIGAALWRDRDMTVPPKDVNFYDYDATIVHSFTAEEFLALEELPGSPQHDGLISQGWNWTLAAAKEYVTKYGACEIGQNYVTDDGKTRIYIELAETERLALSLRFTQNVAAGVVVDWGDGQTETTPDATGNVSLDHTYAQAGAYVVTLAVVSECSVMLGQDTTAMTADSMLLHQKSFVTSKYFGGRSPVLAMEIGEGVTALGTQSMLGLHRMSYITIPTSLTTMYHGVFMACNNVRAIHIPMGVTHINNFSFRGCYAAEAITLPEGLLDCGMYTFFGCTHLERAAIPEGVTALGNTCFAGCYLLERVILPDSVTSLGINCFMTDYSLRKVHIPAGVTAIPVRAFNGCYALTDVEIPEGVLTIGESAFGCCFAIRSLTVPSTVTKIEQFAFLFCDGNEELHILATTPPELDSATAFSNIGQDCEIYVPWSADHSVLAAYLAATNWCGLNGLTEEPAPENAEPSEGGE